MLSFPKSKEKTVVDNEIYLIRDLNLYDSKGRIAFTISTTALKPGQQTFGHKHANESEVYEFVEGYGTMILENSMINVKSGDYVFVEESKYHKVTNLSAVSDLVFKCYFNGEIKRPHLKRH
jgi:mannose-6-phosphate isomerase-like protein (cupin superfamily)